MTLAPAHAVPHAPPRRSPAGTAGWTGYLRVIVNARCSLACTYCHLEGDPATAQARGLSTAELDALLAAGVANGARKIKFLGGEPLLRADLPGRIAALRAADPSLDISLITGGVAPAGRLAACMESGLSRANLSIHGWGLEAFTARTQRSAAAFRQRNTTLDELVAWGRPLKLNFVWRSPDDDADLGGLLAWAAGRPVLVNVLDDLGQPALGPADVRAAVERLRGAPAQTARDDDPHSLPTLRMRWDDGLEVEIKDAHLGATAPWGPCAACPLRAACREGIHAIRLTHEGHIGPCMDRPDLRVDLRAAVAGGQPEVSRRMDAAIAAWSTSFPTSESA